MHRGAPFDLIVEEIRLRKQHGDLDQLTPEIAFPQHAENLKKFFALGEKTWGLQTCSRAQLPTFCVGQTVEDFELLRLLGRGAFAQVFLARQPAMNRLVALKVSADRGDEPKTLSQLDHPHIIRVFDLRRMPVQRIRLLSMQYTPGGTLQNIIHSLKGVPAAALSGRRLLEIVDLQLVEAGLPPPEESPRRLRLADSSWITAVCEIGVQLASALDYAHQLRVLH